MQKEIEEIEEKEIITEEDIDESDPEKIENNENKKYDESRIYYVYEHIRLDKMEPFYIGKGKGERAYDLYRNDHHDAITDEYGHAVVIIADHLTEEEAYWLERDIIEDCVFNLGNGIDIKGHNDYDHELPHLTNMNWGGRGVSSGINAFANKTEEEMGIIGRKISEKNKGKKHSEEHNNKISNSMKGKNAGKNPYTGKTEEEMENICKKKSEAVSGEKNPMYGKKHSDEAKIKMGEAKSKKVVCITTGKIFDSIKDAAIYYNISRVSISYCCKEKLKSSGKLKDGTKLQWKYLEDYNNDFKRILINSNN